VQTRTTGNATVGHRRGAIGLGEMPMSLVGRPAEERSLRTVHAALAAGVSLIDTAGAYASGAADLELTDAEVARLDATG
jgi:aryl-alcohol dehydrogenase-like predicted oxidoreductase